MTTFITQADHPARWANVQIDCCPNIPYDVLNAPCAKVPTQRYEGHLPGSGVQRHSADADFAKYGLVMVAHEAPGRLRIWTGTIHGKPIISGYTYAAVRAATLALTIGA